MRDRFGTDYYNGSPDVDPPGPATGSARVMRGGSWRNADTQARTAVRTGDSPTATPTDDVGARCYRPLQPQ